ncbi:hypothetical protein BASA50_001293 [Batrachochytrium salamandrivorans]|uniref:Uncharacterized protein n=1 Tax=Batrachochytrium salamandrivorans TaxID=1357716 RepID=A0ABQ8EVM1_9FUNG|nr:hypothetical protein BASA50_001293 [Batrachochytrium salamandrivorans]
MKLISFAVVSLLAITVSAYPGPGTPPQDIGAPSAEQHQDVDSQEPLQHQSTDAQECTARSRMLMSQDPQQDQEKELEDEIKKLNEQYKDQKALVVRKKSCRQSTGAKSIGTPGIG